MRLKYEPTDRCLASWTCGHRDKTTDFAPEWIFLVSRWQKADGRKYWQVERDWQAREGCRPPQKLYATTAGLKQSLTVNGHFKRSERLVCNGKNHPDFVSVWKKAGESRAAALARGEETERQRREKFAAAQRQREEVMERLGDDFGTNVTISHDHEGKWNLQVTQFGVGKGAETRFSAKGCATLAEAAEELCNWTKGFVIV